MNKPWKIIDLVYFIGTHDSQPGDTDLNETTKEKPWNIFQKQSR